MQKLLEWPDHSTSEELKKVPASFTAIKQTAGIKQIIEELQKKSRKMMVKGSNKFKPTTRPSGKADVAEVYSPPRVTQMATKLGMKPGWSLDLTCNDEHDDVPWDFNKVDKRSRAMQKLTKD